MILFLTFLSFKSTSRLKRKMNKSKLIPRIVRNKKWRDLISSAVKTLKTQHNNPNILVSYHKKSQIWKTLLLILSLRWLMHRKSLSTTREISHICKNKLLSQMMISNPIYILNPNQIHKMSSCNTIVIHQKTLTKRMNIKVKPTMR
jgi:hypothetical protein